MKWWRAHAVLPRSCTAAPCACSPWPARHVTPPPSTLHRLQHASHACSAGALETHCQADQAVVGGRLCLGCRVKRGEWIKLCVQHIVQADKRQQHPGVESYVSVEYPVVYPR